MQYIRHGNADISQKRRAANLQRHLAVQPRVATGAINIDLQQIALLQQSCHFKLVSSRDGSKVGPIQAHMGAPRNCLERQPDALIVVDAAGIAEAAGEADRASVIAEATIAPATGHRYVASKRLAIPR